MARSPSLEENGVKKGPWTTEEDKKMVDFIEKNGHGSWRALPKLAGLNRCGKSCRLRWTNYLRPDIKRGKFSDEEEQIIINLHSVLGNKWSAIASNLQGRTDNEIKNYWNTHLKKKLMNMGIDPVTHRARTDHLNLFANLPQLLVATNLSSLFVNHDAATQLAKVQLLQNLMQVLNTTTSPQFPSNLNMDPSNYLFSATSSSLFHDHRLFEYLRSTNNNNFSQDHQVDFNGLGNGQVDFSHEQSQLFPLNNENLETFSTNLYDMDSNAHHMPSLVSYSPENFTANEVEESKFMIDREISNPSSASTTIVETWGERVMDDETSDSYWKDIIDQATSFPWTPTL